MDDGGVSRSEFDEVVVGLHGGEGRESFDGQHGVAFGAALDELRGQGVDLVEVERDVEGLRERNLSELAANEGRVARLDLKKSECKH